jgi:glycosyltransferase involved in cell wall biosynthesis
MKVLYSRTQAPTGHISGGALAHTLGVIDGFARLGELVVVTNEPIYGIEQLSRQVPIEIVKPLGSGGLGELFYNFYYPSRLSDKIVQFQPDFVYHRFGGLSYATARVCRKLNVPLILEFNSSPVWGLRQRLHSPKDKLLAVPKIPILKEIESYNLQAAFLIVVPGQPLENYLSELGISHQKMLFNPNAVNPEKFRPISPSTSFAIRRKLGIDQDTTVIGFAGSFGYWHGIPELSKAIKHLNSDPERRGKLFFVFYGDGELRLMLEDAVGSYENVKFAGKIEYAHIQDYLSICDILVSPHGKPPQDSRSIGWPGASPTKIFEYMAMEKGIVASNLDYIGHVIRSGETGVSVPPGDVSALVRGIVYLADHPEEARRLGHNARREVYANHTWEQHTLRIVDKFIALKATGNM